MYKSNESLLPQEPQLGHSLAVTAVGFEESGQEPLGETERAVLDELVLGIIDLADGTRDRGISAFQNNAGDPAGASNNFRNQLWDQVGIHAVDSNVLAQLAASEIQGAKLVLSSEEAIALQLAVPENSPQVFVSNVTRRMASFFTESGVIVIEEAEFPLKNERGDTILKRLMTAKPTKM